ncbi:hypothetical protein FACS18948_2650 [Clostridia bacterium]|nr:hypothetical protein FACS18948_2650 [Clostridia bacterium]
MASTWGMTPEQKLALDIASGKINLEDGSFLMRLYKDDPDLLSKLISESPLANGWLRYLMSRLANSRITDVDMEELQSLRDGRDEKKIAQFSPLEAAVLKNRILESLYNNEEKEKSIFDADVLMSTEIEPIHWVVPDLVPEGLCMLAAPPKVGKSWMALDLAIQVAGGNPFLGFPTVKSGVVYFALEDSRRRLKDRINLILGGNETDACLSNLHIQTQTEQDFITHLETVLFAEAESDANYAEPEKTTRLIIIDVFQKIRRDNPRASSMYSREYAEMERLKKLADRFHVCILLIHHTRKMTDSDTFNMISGSTALMGSCDATYMIERPDRNENRARLLVSGRDVRDAAWEMTFDDERHRWVRGLSHEEAQLDEFIDSPMVVAINALLNKSGHIEMTATDLGQRLIEECDWLSEEEVRPKALGMWLSDNRKKLSTIHICYANRRIHNRRLCILERQGA